RSRADGSSGPQESTRAASHLLRQLRLALLCPRPLASRTALPPVPAISRGGGDPRAARCAIHERQSRRRAALSRAADDARLRAPLWLGVGARAPGRVAAPRERGGAAL